MWFWFCTFVVCLLSLLLFVAMMYHTETTKPGSAHEQYEGRLVCVYGTLKDFSKRIAIAIENAPPDGVINVGDQNSQLCWIGYVFTPKSKKRFMKFANLIEGCLHNKLLECHVTYDAPKVSVERHKYLLSVLPITQMFTTGRVEKKMHVDVVLKVLPITQAFTIGWVERKMHVVVVNHRTIKLCAVRMVVEDMSQLKYSKNGTQYSHVTVCSDPRVKGFGAWESSTLLRETDPDQKQIC